MSYRLSCFSEIDGRGKLIILISTSRVRRQKYWKTTSINVTQSTKYVQNKLRRSKFFFGFRIGVIWASLNR